MIAAIMGHRSMAMVDRYLDSAVPPMAKVPINLFHPEDPILPASKQVKHRLVAVR